MDNNFLTRDDFINYRDLGYNILDEAETQYAIAKDGTAYVRRNGKTEYIIEENSLSANNIRSSGYLQHTALEVNQVVHLNYSGCWVYNLTLTIPGRIQEGDFENIYSAIESKFYPNQEVIRYKDYIPLENSESERQEETATEQKLIKKERGLNPFQ